MNKRILCLVPGFGEPYMDRKITIFKENYNKITQQQIGIQYIICCYQPNIDLIKINEIFNKKDISIIYEKGIVVDFLVKYLNPEKINSNFDRVLILFDDIEILNVNFLVLDNLLINHKLDIISPSLSNNSVYSHTYMLTTGKDTLRLVTHLELFFYYMTVSSFSKYYEYLDIKNKWAWGIDLIIGKKLLLGLVDSMTMRHHIIKSSYKNHQDYDPKLLLINYLKSRNEEPIKYKEEFIKLNNKEMNMNMNMNINIKDKGLNVKSLKPLNKKKKILMRLM